MEENDYLRLLINDNEQKKLHIFDKERHCYSKELQECVYELLNHNITTSHVGPVINSVLNMIGVKANKLPSTSTINNMNDQRLILAQSQIGEELAKNQNTCLLSDETSKFGQKFEEFHISDGDGRLWVFGLRQLVTKSGYFNHIK